MLSNDGNNKGELLKTVPLHGKTQSFYASLLEMEVSIHKLLPVTTNGAPVVTIENAGLIWLCKQDPAFQYF
jgi:hypothetical protein